MSSETVNPENLPVEDVSIHPMEELPEKLRGTNKELNMIEYKDHRVHLAGINGEIYGAIRSALRDDSRRRHGFLGDLQVEEENRGQGLEELLIEAGERRLFEDENCTRIDAIMKDGEGWTRHFVNCDFWTSRKTVDIAWNLDELAPFEIPSLSEVTVEEIRSPDVEKMTNFILDSYQPYWRFWKEYKDDMRWIRVEYGEDEEPPESEEIREEMHDRVRKKLNSFNTDRDQVFYLARRDGDIIAACDALDRQEGDTFEWGMLAVYDYGVKELGSALVGRSLNWLAEREHSVARIKTTSGLDDYDPTVYLYTAANQAQIVDEYVNCTKLETGDEPDEEVSDATF